MKKVKILILASNPIDTGRLRVGEELKKIEKAIKNSKYRDYIDVISKLAVTIDDFRQALLEEKPDILHFTGHGTGDLPSEFKINTRDINLAQTPENKNKNGCLVIETEVGTKNFIKPKTVANLISLFKDDIKCVVLAACHSQYQASLFAKDIKYAIGMKKAINDNSAIAFSTAFYEAIGNAGNIPDAFKYASINIALNNLDGEDIPELNINKKVKKHKAIVNAKKIEKEKNKKELGDTIKIKGNNNKTIQGGTINGDLNM